MDFTAVKFKRPMKTKRTWYGVYMGDDVYAVRHDGNVYKLSNENNSIANRSIVMIKKLIDKWFPKKYVLINVRRGGYVGEIYNLVPYKRTLSKSQNTCLYFIRGSIFHEGTSRNLKNQYRIWILMTIRMKNECWLIRIAQSGGQRTKPSRLLKRQTLG